MRLDRLPLTVHVVTSLVLNRRQTIGLHVAGKEFLVVLSNARLEHEDARGYAHAEEQVLRQFDDLTEAVILQNPIHLRS